MSNINEMLQKRAGLVEQSREITAKAIETEKRAMTAEEHVSNDKVHAEILAIDKTIEAEKAQRAIARASAAFVDQEKETAVKGVKKDDADSAFRSFLLTGNYGQGKGASELRALQADSDIIGGYLAPPPAFVAQLIKNVDDLLIMRGKSTVIPVTGTGSLGVPTLTANPADAAWTSEIGTSSEDSSMRFGKRELQPHLLTKHLKVSRQLLRVSAISIDSFVAERLAYIIALPQEKAFMTGTGAGQPLGIFTASADGVTTARDVSTGNTQTAFTVDGLINAKFSLKSQYQSTAEWYFHRDAVKELSKLKDGEGRYLWNASIVSGQPDMLLGRPVNQSENVPNTFRYGLYVGAFCDMKHYWIAESQQFELQRADERYIETNQVGFFVRAQIDAQPVLAEAFARVKLAP